MSIIYIRDKNGDLIPLQTIKGEDGKTPVKGEDYFTPNDKADIVNSVLEELPTWTGANLTAEQITALDDMFKICAFIKADVSAEYNAFKTAFGIDGEDEPGDTSPVIVAYDKGLSVYPGTINDFSGVCYTKVYRYEPDIERMKANSAYDPENDYMKSNAIAGVIVHYAPNTKMLEAGYSISGIVTSASKIWQYRDDTVATYYSNANLSASAGTALSEVRLQFGRNNTDIMYSNGIAFSLSILDAEDSYAYWSDALNAILPIGIKSGDIIFAGKNTKYYGMKNISEYTEE